MPQEIHYICPLKIPQGHNLMYQRQRRFDSGFPQNLTLDQAVAYLEDELLSLPAEKINVFTNYDRINSERNRVKREDDSAVTVEIKMGSRTYYLICDRWAQIDHNLYALHLSIRAIKNIVKWGVGDYETLLAGFDAAGKHAGFDRADDRSAILPEWMKTLGLGLNATLDDANAIYRRRAKESADNEHKLLELNQAIEAARKHFGVL